MDDEEPEVTAPQPPRRPFCMDCLGRGAVQQPRAALVREPDGAPEITSTLVPARCPACRGTGRAGV